MVEELLGKDLEAKERLKVLEKCQKKLSRWKAQYLSLGGSLSLINAVLDALLTYMLSLFPILLGIVQSLEN